MTWEDKRMEILERDNFTCQICKQFNPELGMVEFYDEVENQVELHSYNNSPDPFQASYLIAQSKTGYSFNISFGICWPVFPIMQVHHKKYINGKESWDYDNEDLITLCKKCHIELHLRQTISIYSEDNSLIEERMFLPVDFGAGRRHNCDDWTFIKQSGGGEYMVSNIEPSITFITQEHHDKADIEREGKNALNRLINNFFPRYSRQK